MTVIGNHHWQKKQLKDVAEYINGRGFKKSEWVKSGKPIIRIQNLTGSSKTINYFDGMADSKHQITDGDLLVSWSATIGSYIYRGDDAVLNQHIFKVVPKINKLFLHYYLSYIGQLLYSKTHGTGMSHITKGVFDSIDISFPEDESKQQEVVEKIEELFSVIDFNLHELRKVESQLIRYKYSYVQKILNNLGKQASKVKLNDVAESVRYGSSTKTSEDDRNGVVVLRMGNYDEFGKKTKSSYKYLPKNHNEFPELLLKKGDLLFNRTNSAELVGKTMVYGDQFPSPCSYASYLIRARFDEKKVNSKYVMHTLNSLTGKSWIRSVVNQQVGQANVNGTKLKNFELHLPTISEQDVGVNRIEHAFSIIDTNLTTINLLVRKSEALRQSILKQAFEGKVV